MNAAAFIAAADRSAGAGWSLFRVGQRGQRLAQTRIYEITDRLQDGRTVRVPGNQILHTVSAWLGELGVDSPLVGDLACAVRSGDWPVAYSLGERLSVDITVAV